MDDDEDVYDIWCEGLSSLDESESSTEEVGDDELDDDEFEEWSEVEDEEGERV